MCYVRTGTVRGVRIRIRVYSPNAMVEQFLEHCSGQDFDWINHPLLSVSSESSVINFTVALSLIE